MNLVVHIPDQATEECAQALSLAQRAPSFTIEWTNNQRTAVAIFPALPEGIDLAVQLIGEAVRLPSAWASVDTKPISSLTKLWQRVSCYRDSLDVEDRARYCREKSALFHSLVGCEERRCPVPCQFICTPCMGMTQNGSAIDSGDQYRVAAVLAEIDWCPNLRMP